MDSNNAGETIYLGKVKEQNGKFGTFMTGYISADLVKQHAKGKYTSFVISKLKEADEYGNTHSIKLSNYKPTEGGTKPAAKAEVSKPASKSNDDTVLEDVSDDENADLSNIGF